MITQIKPAYSSSLITVGKVINDRVDLGIVKEITFHNGVCAEDEYIKEYYIVKFEDSSKTLDLSDVNYVIRDEE